MKVVIDTSVLVAAIIGPKGPSREVIRMCLNGVLLPQLSSALITEYEDVTAREEILRQSRISEQEVSQLIDAVFSVSEAVRLYFAWRPNLRDEGDNHVMELAIAAGATVITNNVRDFTSGELQFPGTGVYSPKGFLEQWRANNGNIDN